MSFIKKMKKYFTEIFEQVPVPPVQNEEKPDDISCGECECVEETPKETKPKRTRKVSVPKAKLEKKVAVKKAKAKVLPKAP